MLYVGTKKEVKNNLLTKGDEGKFWATSKLEYAWAYATSPLGVSHFHDSEREWGYRFPEGERNNGFIYRIVHPEVYNKEGNIEYTSTHFLGAHVELLERSFDGSLI